MLNFDTTSELLTAALEAIEETSGADAHYATAEAADLLLGDAHRTLTRLGYRVRRLEEVSQKTDPLELSPDGFMNVYRRKADVLKWSHRAATYILVLGTFGYNEPAKALDSLCAYIDMEVYL